jgi:hypothetical protein
LQPIGCMRSAMKRNVWLSWTSTGKKTTREGQTWPQIKDGKTTAESQLGRLSAYLVNDGVKHMRYDRPVG